MKHPKLSDLELKEFKTSLFKPEDEFFAVLEAKTPGFDIHGWLSANKELVNGLLISHGAILFRQCGAEEATFKKFANSLYDDSLFMTYGKAGISPRTKVADGVYESSAYPPHLRLTQHLEQSYIPDGWPTKVMFMCQIPSATGGETPITDMRKFKRQIGSELFQKFSKLGVIYKRMYTKDGFGSPWQAAFETNDPKQVEKICAQLNMECQWLGPDRLRTINPAQGTAIHPVTGEELWMNHSHVFSAYSKSSKHVTPAVELFVKAFPPEKRDKVLEQIEKDPESLPIIVDYGDKTHIDVDTLWHIENTMQACSTQFPWQKGDVVLLDNMLCAHGRNPFTGDRRILAILLDPYSKDAVAKKKSA